MSDSEVETDICDMEQCNDVDEANNNDNAIESFEAKLVIKGRSTVWNHFIFKGSKVKGQRYIFLKWYRFFSPKESRFMSPIFYSFNQHCTLNF